VLLVGSTASDRSLLFWDANPKQIVAASEIIPTRKAIRPKRGFLENHPNIRLFGFAVLQVGGSGSGASDVSTIETFGLGFQHNEGLVTGRTWAWMGA
jgi:hypothetical protein